METLLPAIVDAAILIFAVTSMLSVGLGHTLRQIVEPLRHTPGLIRTLAANFVLVPALGLFLVRIMGLDRPLAIGLFLVASAAGAAFLIKLTQASRGDMALASALLLLLLPTTVLYLAFVLPTALPEAAVGVWAIASPLVLTLLLPLAVGLVLRRLAPRPAAAAVRPLGRVSTVALAVFVAGTIFGNLPAFQRLIGTGAIFTALALTLGAFAIGFTLGGRRPEVRNVVALATAQRNISAAAVVATQTFRDPAVLVMVVLTSLVGFAVLFPITFAFRKSATRRAAARRPLRLHRRREA